MGEPLHPPGVGGVLGRDREVGHRRRRERGRERFGHGRPEAAADAAPHTRIRPPTSAPAAISRVTASPAGRSSEVLAIGVPSAPSIARQRPGSRPRNGATTASRSSSRGLGRHRRPGAIRLSAGRVDGRKSVRVDDEHAIEPGSRQDLFDRGLRACQSDLGLLVATDAVECPQPPSGSSGSSSCMI